MINDGLIVFVTFEVYPFTSGGLGRFIYNTLRGMTPEERCRTLVISTTGHISKDAFEAVFPGASLENLNEFTSGATDLRYTVTNDDWMFAISNKIMLMLKGISEKRPIQYVEFPDWGGFAFATLQERLARKFLLGTRIAVRLHSTEGILVLRESRMLEGKDLRCFDLERKSLLDCDLIVGHLKPVAEETRRSFVSDGSALETNRVT